MSIIANIFFIIFSYFLFSKLYNFFYIYFAFFPSVYSNYYTLT